MRAIFTMELDNVYLCAECEAPMPVGILSTTRLCAFEGNTPVEEIICLDCVDK